MWAWGQGADGRLGDGGTGNSFGTAVQVQFPAGGSDAKGGQATTAATPVAVDTGAAVISSTAGNVAVAGP